jgi:hypothetical protein
MDPAVLDDLVESHDGPDAPEAAMPWGASVEEVE